MRLNTYPTNDIDLAFEVEATYWTKRILGEYPDDSPYEMRELVDSLIANQMEVAA